MESIRVAVRIRPDEVSFGDSCLQIDQSSKALKIIKKLDDTNRTEAFDYTFDNVFGPETSQEEIFSDVRELINESLNGFNVTVFAFGMTGSGKTFTIAGNPQQPGIVPRTVNHIFTDLQQKSNKSKDTMAMVFLTYVELYNNSLYDLLASELPDGEENAVGLKLHEHPNKGMQISGSPTLRAPVTSAEQALKLISQGNKLRATSSTNLNERSSRSHTVISFEIVSQDISAGAGRVGKINLVDLAGSERVKQSGAEGQAMEEAKQINKALSVLGDVLNSLSKYHQGLSSKRPTSGIKSPLGSSSKSLSPVPHIPFRNSKLTMLLKDSLGGNAKTMMIATIRTSAAFYQQSLVSLRYAARARHIKCNPIQNVADTVGEGVGNIMQQTLLEVNRLKSQLEHRNEESNALKARLNELEKSKKQSEAKGNAFAEETKKKLLEQIDDLQVRSGKERQELTERLMSVIHHHEGAVAAEQKVHTQLRGQLALKSSHIEALSYEHQEALVSIGKAEIIMNNVTLQLSDRDAVIVTLKGENALLSSQLLEEKNVREKITVAAGREKEQLVDALQKLTSSRNKYKKRSEEHSASLDKLFAYLKNSNLMRDDHIVQQSSGMCEGSDVIILQLEELLKENSKKSMDKRMEDEGKMEEIGDEKDRAVSEMEHFRSENVLLMEKVLQLDSERKKGDIEVLKSQGILEERISEFKNALRKEEKSRKVLKEKTKELSIELRDSLQRETETAEEKSKIIEHLQSENLRLQNLIHNMSVPDPEKERTDADMLSVLTQKIIESDEKYQIVQDDSEKYRLNSETELENLKKEILEVTGNNSKQDERILELGCEISSLQGRNEELVCDLKSKNEDHEREIISLLAAAEIMRNKMNDAGDLFTLEKQEKQDIQGANKELEEKLETEIKNKNELLDNIRLESVLERGVLEGIITSLRAQLQVSYNAMSGLEATTAEIEAENCNMKTDYSSIKAVYENVKLEKERMEAENKRMKIEFETTITSLSDDLANSNEKLSHSVEKSESDEREKIIKHEYGRKILVLTEQLVKLQSEYSMQTESYCSYKNEVQEKLKEIEENEENAQIKLKLIEEQANVEESRELNNNNVLNNRIAMMVSSEEDMFSFLKGRLIDLDDARSKLIKLQQSAMTGDKSDLELYLLAEQQDAHLALEDKLASAQVRVISFEAELKRSRDVNKDLHLELEKKSKQLALEQQKSRTYLSDRDRIRKVTAEELKNTVSLVRKRVEIGQTRRHSELVSARDNVVDLPSTGRVYQNNKSSLLSTSVISDGSIDTNLGNMSFEDTVWA